VPELSVINRIYYSLHYGRGLYLKAKTKAKDLGPRPRPRPRTLLSRPRPLLFVLKAPRGRGQVLEETSLQ